VGEIMLWKATYRLGEIKTYSSVGTDKNTSKPKASVSRDAPRAPATTPGLDDDAPERAARSLKSTENHASQNFIDAMNREKEEAKRTRANAPSVEYLPQLKATQREGEIITKLDQPISFDFTDEPLSAALRQLEKQVGFNIWLDVASMKKHNLAENQVVTLRVRDISLKNALRLMLDSCELTYLLEHERMTVLPKLEVNLRLETRIYPVRDLIVEKDDFETLIIAIKASVAPESWLGGERASISKVPATGSLVIFQTPGVHADILRLLRTLREAKEVPAAGAGVSRQGQDAPTAGIGIGANGGGGGGFF
jgi:hypothetical protein